MLLAVATSAAGTKLVDQQLQNSNGHLIGHNLSQHFQIQSITTRPLGQQDAKKPNCCRDLSKSCKSSYLWTCDPAWGPLTCVGDMHTQGIFTLVTISSKRLRVLIQTCTIHKTVNLDRCSRQTSFLQAWWMHYKSSIWPAESSWCMGFKTALSWQRVRYLLNPWLWLLYNSTSAQILSPKKQISGVGMNRQCLLIQTRFADLWDAWE
jgi:hypothetical protein